MTQRKPITDEEFEEQLAKDIEEKWPEIRKELAELFPDVSDDQQKPFKYLLLLGGIDDQDLTLKRIYNSHLTASPIRKDIAYSVWGMHMDTEDRDPASVLILVRTDTPKKRIMHEINRAQTFFREQIDDRFMKMMMRPEYCYIYVQGWKADQDFKGRAKAAVSDAPKRKCVIVASAAAWPPHAPAPSGSDCATIVCGCEGHLYLFADHTTTENWIREAFLDVEANC